MQTAKMTREIARQNLSGNWGLAVGVYIVFSLIVGATSSFAITPMLSIVSVVAMILITPPITLGYMLFNININRRKNYELGNLFVYFKVDYSKAMAIYWLKTAFIFLWSLLLFIPGIIKSYSYAMSEYLVINKIKDGPSEAITLSRELMNGNKWRLFCLHFSFVGWMLLSVLTFGILMLWIAPYMNVAETAFYEEIARKAGLVSDNVVQPTEIVRDGDAGNNNRVDDRFNSDDRFDYDRFGAGRGAGGETQVDKNQPTIAEESDEHKSEDDKNDRT